jgi:energy-coupling factor transport system substrate-specific component
VSWQLASLGLLGVALSAGFVAYERSRPSSRTVALVATLAALATLGRLAFAPIPNVKPTTDIVLIAGYVLGGAPGFTVGAVSAIASNVVLSEGPWTPWQMLAWGLVGIAGWLLSLRGGPRRRVPMAICCALAGFGYGFIVDLYTWIGYSQHTLGQYLAVESAALPFNVAHAAGNAAFYLAFGPALVRALRRFRERLEVRWLAAGTPLALALAVLLAGTSALRSAPASAAAAGSPLAYLERAQRPDGGFGLAPGQPPDAAATCWALIGLAAAHAPAHVLERAAAWIGGHQGQIQTPGDLERTILALAAARAPLHGLLARLARERARDGSFREQANWTAFAILAQRAAGAATAGEPDWLARQENADGGFGFGTRGDPSDIDDTAGAVEALVAAGRPAVRAVRYLERQENRDGGFPLEPGGDSNAQSTAWAAQALLAAHAPAARGLRWLESRVEPSGAVDSAPGNTQTPVWVTGEALAALVRAPLPYVSRR